MVILLGESKECGYKESMYLGVQNDLDGIQPCNIVRLIQNNQWTSLLQMFDLINHLDTDCWKGQKLIHPDYRDKLIRLIENSDIDDNSIVQIFQLKK